MDADKLIHDWLLEHRPEGASHEEDDCPFCTQRPSGLEEAVTDEQKIFTQEQHEQLLVSAVEKALNEAQRASDAEILRLNERVEASEKELADRDAKIEELSSVIAEREEQERLEALADERVELVKAAANFSADQIKERRLAWAKMPEEDFGAYLEDIRAVAKSPKDEDKDPETKFDGTRETAGDDGTEQSAIATFFSSALQTADL
jgi:uncharacterized Zn finger protein (UPF0148 family)